MYSFSLINGMAGSDPGAEVEKILSHYPSGTADPGKLRLIFSCMDYTSLDGTDHPAKIEAFCRSALSYGEKGLPYPAAVCVYPPFVSVARETLRGSPIRVAATAGAFPGGQMALHVKLEEIRYVVSEGADEVDVVIPRGMLLSGNYTGVFRELDAMREVSAGLTLKVILETGELVTPENIARASEIAIEAGADFIKTSTGKITPGATEEAVWVMLKIIREHHRRTGKKVGLKPAGGIAEPARAIALSNLVADMLGPEWLSPGLFRVGASRLADRLAGLIP